MHVLRVHHTALSLLSVRFLHPLNIFLVLLGSTLDGSRLFLTPGADDLFILHPQEVTAATNTIFWSPLAGALALAAIATATFAASEHLLGLTRVGWHVIANDVGVKSSAQ